MKKTYSTIKGCQLPLKTYSYIDYIYLSNAENDIKYIMTALKLSIIYKNQDELVVLPKETFKLIKTQYAQISTNYMGHVTELNYKMKELENQLELQPHKYTYTLEINELKGI